MSDFNRVILIGRIGNDLELKKSAQDHSYLRISLATNFYKGEEKTTHWHRVMVFGDQADRCATHLRKGSQIMVEGMLEVQTYTDKEERKTTRVSVIAQRVNFLGSKPANPFMRQDDQHVEAIPA